QDFAKSFDPNAPDLGLGGERFDKERATRPEFYQSRVAFLNDIEKTEVGQRALSEARQKRVAQQYEQWSQHKTALQNHLQNGNRGKAIGTIEDLSQRISMPYEYKYDPDSGKFHEYFIDDDNSKERTGESLGVDEAAKRIIDMREEEMIGISNQHIGALIQRNRDAYNDESRWKYLKDEEGNTYTAVPQMSVDNTGETTYDILEHQGDDRFTVQELADMGLRVENLEKEGARADKERTEQATRASKAQEEMYRNQGLAALREAEGDAKKLDEDTLKTIDNITKNEMGEQDHDLALTLRRVAVKAQQEGQYPIAAIHDYLREQPEREQQEEKQAIIELAQNNPKEAEKYIESYYRAYGGGQDRDEFLRREFPELFQGREEQSKPKSQGTPSPGGLPRGQSFSPRGGSGSLPDTGGMSPSDAWKGIKGFWDRSKTPPQR
ncbi:MAG: hypothetical protein ACOC43_13890, partial [Desulfohalobiaceae bacterium]